MKCPACKDIVLTMSERNGIEIDYCHSCRGIWLDRGELDKIIAKSQLDKPEVQVTTMPRQKIQEVIYRDSSSQNYKKDDYKHKRKKSFFEELFD